MSGAEAGVSRSVVARYSGDGVRTEVEVGGRTITADEPAEQGGGNAGPTPFELLYGSLGACMVVTAAMYARRKGWPLTGAELRIDGVHEGYRLASARSEVRFEGDLTAAQVERLRQIVDRCPVHQTLEQGVVFEPTTLLGD
ncbi:MAG: OsmC family protein [Planctomycetota bacterium]